MGEFDASWLALREPLDRAARHPGLLRRAAALVRRRPGAVVADLGCGAGSNGRALSPWFGRGQRWRLIDHDPDLLAEALRNPPAGGRVEAVHADLAPVEALPLEDVCLVTASALFDLASEAWLRRLAAVLAERRLPLYATLTYDGRIAWSPAHPLDEAMRAALNAHQGTDKGFGPALGPAAAARLPALLAACGFAVMRAPSPWNAGPAHAALQRSVADTQAAAALDLDAAPHAAVTEWRAFRHAAAVTGGLVLGHADVLAVPGVGPIRPRRRAQPAAVP